MSDKTLTTRLAKALEPFADVLEYPEEATGDEEGMIQVYVSIEDVKAAQALLHEYNQAKGGE